MANEYYDNSEPSQRFMGGETARGSDVDSKFDEVEAGLDKLPTADRLNFGAANYGSCSGTGNAYLVTLPKTPDSYFAGMKISFIASSANTSGCTVNVNNKGVASLLRQDGAPLRAGDISAGSPVTAIRSGSAFLLCAPTSKMATEAEAAAQSAEQNALAAQDAQQDVTAKAEQVESDRQQAEASAALALQIAGLDPNDFYLKEDVDQAIQVAVGALSQSLPVAHFEKKYFGGM